MSVNQADELALFSSLADKWWDPEGPMQPLHRLNPLRLEFIKRFMSLSSNAVLDVGCGAGLLSEAMAKAGANVTGIDLSQAVIDVAKEHAANAGVSIDYQCIALEDLASKQADHYDAITCMELLEHVEYPVALLKSCYTALKPGGWCLLSTINRTPPAFIKAILGAEYLLGLLPKGTHHYRQFIKPAELADWSREAGFLVGPRQGVSIGMGNDYRFTNDMSVNYLMAVQKAKE